jgi:peptide deformylase
MAVREILLLGNPKLYEISKEVNENELTELRGIIADLHDTMMDFKEKYGAGRAIAAPQIGVMKRFIYMYIDKEIIFINPVLEFKNNEMMELWDDCMSFPDLLVKVKRYRNTRIKYYDMNWEEKTMDLDGDLSELIQHEYDHLNGILAISRAIDSKSFSLRSQYKYLK